MKKAFVCMATALLMATPAMAQHANTELTNCVIQAPIPGKHMTGAFLKITHHGAPVEIKSVAVPSVTEQAELHTMTMQDNVMTMAPMTDLKLPDGERIFRKGGDHIMLMKIPADKLPKAGEKHQITMQLSDGSSASCDALVKTPEEVIKDSKMSHEHMQSHQHQH